MTDPLHNCYFCFRRYQIYCRALLIENAYALKNDKKLYHQTIESMKNDFAELKNDVKLLRESGVIR